jgi:hypothetical protein
VEKMICSYCGAEKTEVSFYIGASLPSDRGWTMHEGTGKVSCDSDVCHAKGELEGREAIDKYLKSLKR